MKSNTNMFKELIPRRIEIEDKNVQKAMLTPKNYKKLRMLIGTQVYVSKLLGIEVITLSRREKGHTPLKLDHIYALEYLIAHFGLQVQ